MFSRESDIPLDAFNKHFFQSVLYSRLISDGEERIHEGNQFRFFCFSDFFPSGPMPRGKKKNILISSPDKKLVGKIAKVLTEDSTLYLKDQRLDIASVKSFGNFKVPDEFETGSPIVLYQDNRKGEFFSIKDGGNLSFFMERIKENAVKKYKQFTGKDPLYINGPLFDGLVFKKEVSVKVDHRNGNFFIIGSLWKRLKINQSRKIDYSFYNFLMDCGIGEKNSLGFGFLNPVRESVDSGK